MRIGLREIVMHIAILGAFALPLFFLISAGLPIPIAEAQANRYDIEYSLQFNSANSRYLSKVFSSPGTTTKWTFSAWVKRDSAGGLQTILSAERNSSNYTGIWFYGANNFAFEAAGTGGTAVKVSSATFSSTSAWYHIVVAVDTSQATANNRNRLYVNGEEITSFSTNTNLALNSQTHVTDDLDGSNNVITHYIGRWASGDYFNGLMADVILVSGQQLTPSSFGYDDNGTWRPKAFIAATSSTNSMFGTNGFYLNFASSTRLGRNLAASTSASTADFTLTNITSSQQSATTPQGTTRFGAASSTPSGETFISGPLLIQGGASVAYNLSKGAGTFVIDHVLDPLNKLLYHSFVESPDMKNIYDGIASLDEKGSATIELPKYLLALNRDFRYLGTPMGESMPNLHVSTEVRRKWFLWGVPVFKIQGGIPNGKISWQITGIRHDPFAEKNRIPVEVEKGPDELMEKGEYVHPELYQ